MLSNTIVSSSFILSLIIASFELLSILLSNCSFSLFLSSNSSKVNVSFWYSFSKLFKIPLFISSELFSFSFEITYSFFSKVSYFPIKWDLSKELLIWSLNWIYISCSFSNFISNFVGCMFTSIFEGFISIFKKHTACLFIGIKDL